MRQSEGAANATVNRELALLKRMFSLAVKDGKLHGKPHIPMLREDNTRRGFGRSFPFTAALEALLKEQLAEFDRLKKENRVVPYVFHRDGTRIRDFRAAWATACQKAGCAGRLPHDFRRTAVRNLEKAGVPRSAAMTMVGHKTEAIYRR